MKSQRLVVLALFFVAAMTAVAGCGGGGSGGGGGGATQISVNTLDGSIDVPANSVFLYSFGQPVTASTVTGTSFFILPAPAAAASVIRAAIDPAVCDVQQALPATVSCPSINQCMLDPTDLLSSATRYTICLTTGITMSTGQAFEGFMASFTTALSPLLPPANVTVMPSAASTELVVSWNAVEGATSYNLHWATTPGVTATNSTRVAGVTSPWTHTGLTTGTAYYYRVAGVSADGEGPLSGEVSNSPQIDAVGTLDTTFNGTGFLQYGTIDTIAEGVVIDGQGRIVAVGSIWDAVTQFDLAVWRYNADGTPDTSFGIGGLVQLHNTAGGNGWDRGFGVAIDANGRIVAVGESDNPAAKRELVVWRFNADGSADTSFGTNGAVLFDRGIGMNNFAYGVTLDASGRITVTGLCSGAANDDMVLLRYNDDGTPDTTFGTGGVVYSDNAAGGNGPDQGDAVVVDQDNTTFVTGTSRGADGNDHLVVWEYTSSGVLDPTFDGDGVYVYPDGVYGAGADIDIDASNRVVVVGSLVTANSDAIALRLTALGALDTTFNGDGTFLYGETQTDSASSVSIDDRGRIIVGGMFGTSANSSDLLLMRLTSAGELDTTFGIGGVVRYHNGSIANSEDGAYGLELDAMGRIVLAGQTGAYGDWYMALWRYQ